MVSTETDLLAYIRRVSEGDYDGEDELIRLILAEGSMHGYGGEQILAAVRYAFEGVEDPDGEDIYGLVMSRAKGNYGKRSRRKKC